MLERVHWNEFEQKLRQSNTIAQRSARETPAGEATAAAAAEGRRSAREAVVQGENENVRPGIGREPNAQGQIENLTRPTRHRCRALEACSLCNPT